MLATIAKVLGLFAGASCLAVSLMLLPATIVLSMGQRFGPLGRGQYGMTLAALITAIPFGVAFGAIPTRHVVSKSLAVSAGDRY